MKHIVPSLLVVLLISAGVFLAPPVPCAAQPESGQDTTSAEPAGDAAPAQTADRPGPQGKAESQAGAPNPRVSIEVSVESDTGQQTALGRIVIELYRQDAPKHVANFMKLVREGFYEGTTFHRIVPAFVVQGGDLVSKRNWKSSRVGTGSDGPDYKVPAEIGSKHVRGAVAAARTQDAVNPNKESSPSQFYICLADLPALDRMGYSVFGKVVEGMDVVDKIARVKNSGPPKNQALQRVHMTTVSVVK